MKFYLVDYDRASGAVRVEPFDGEQGRSRALARRFELERAGSSGHEIVVLSAESEDDLQRTHARYFHSASEMAAAGATRRWAVTGR